MKSSDEQTSTVCTVSWTLYLCVQANEADIIIVGHHCNRLFVSISDFISCEYRKKWTERMGARERESWDKELQNDWTRWNLASTILM